MIPTHWTPQRRAADGEVVGYLAPADDDLVVPTSLLGQPLGDATSHDDAADLLERTGLAMLGETWQLDVAGIQVPVELVQVTPATVLLKSVDIADAFRSYGEMFTLDLPAGDELRRR